MRERWLRRLSARLDVEEPPADLWDRAVGREVAAPAGEPLAPRIAAGVIALAITAGLVLGGWLLFRGTGERTPGGGGALGGAEGVARIVCGEEGRPQILTPEVIRQPDGVHFELENPGGATSLWTRDPHDAQRSWARGALAEHASTSFVLPIPAGEVLVTCLHGPTAAAELPQEEFAALTVLPGPVPGPSPSSSPTGDDCRGPRVWTIPEEAPPGTRVTLVGECFEEDWEVGYGLFLLRQFEDAPECEVIASVAPYEIEVDEHGGARGSFTVPERGPCFQQDYEREVTPGRYFIGIGCHPCTGGRFRVTRIEPPSLDVALDCPISQQEPFRRTGPVITPGGSAFIRGNLEGIRQSDVVEQVTRTLEGDTEWDGTWQVVRDGRVIALVDWASLRGIACRDSGIAGP